MDILYTPCIREMEIALDLATITTAKAGTPIDADGKVANTNKAIGLLKEDFNKAARPWTDKAKLIIGGMVDLAAAEASYGSSLSSAAKVAMNGITFIKSNGQVDAYTYTLPAASASEIGGVKKAEAVAYAAGDAPTAAEFAALIDALVASGALTAPPEPPEPEADPEE